uniref:Uncharacterized protein n=1 Tax=Chrysemys picta bellii TaxID=8478 RepID=A0A8C3FL89_CHRPI
MKGRRGLSPTKPGVKTQASWLAPHPCCLPSRPCELIIFPRGLEIYGSVFSTSAALCFEPSCPGGEIRKPRPSGCLTSDAPTFISCQPQYLLCWDWGLVVRAGGAGAGGAGHQDTWVLSPALGGEWGLGVVGGLGSRTPGFTLRLRSPSAPSFSPPDRCAHCALACLFCEFLALCSLALDGLGCGALCLAGGCCARGDPPGQGCGGGSCPCGGGCGLLQDCCDSADCLEICLECCSICFPG